MEDNSTSCAASEEKRATMTAEDSNICDDSKQQVSGISHSGKNDMDQVIESKLEMKADSTHSLVPRKVGFRGPVTNISLCNDDEQGYTGAVITVSREGRKSRNRQKLNIPSNREASSFEAQWLRQYPLDGTWAIVWYVHGIERKETIMVEKSEYHVAGYCFHLHLDDPIHPWLAWPRSPIIQTVQSGVNLREETIGPPIGGRIVWTTTSPDFPIIYWIRRTIGKPSSSNSTTFEPDQLWSQNLQDLAFHQRDSLLPKYNRYSIWGNVFIKKYRVGNASYHFLSPQLGGYVSFEHPACRQLPPLDDGRPFPSRIHFHNLEYNPLERSLTAMLGWEQDFGVTWNDNVRWKLDMQFDTQFICILRGGIQCEWSHIRHAPNQPRPPPSPHRPPPIPVYVPPTPSADSPIVSSQEERNEEWRMSGYGYDQLYMNAAILERFRDLPEDPKEGATNGSKYFKMCQRMLQRLEEEGATERTRQMIEYVLRASEDPNAHVIDFNTKQMDDAMQDERESMDDSSNASMREFPGAVFVQGPQARSNNEDAETVVSVNQNVEPIVAGNDIIFNEELRQVEAHVVPEEQDLEEILKFKRLNDELQQRLKEERKREVVTVALAEMVVSVQGQTICNLPSHIFFLGVVAVILVGIALGIAIGILSTQ